MYVWVCVYVCVRVSAASPAVAADVTPSQGPYIHQLRPSRYLSYHQTDPQRFLVASNE